MLQFYHQISVINEEMTKRLRKQQKIVEATIEGSVPMNNLLFVGGDEIYRKL